jgi:hypothetical protein
MVEIAREHPDMIRAALMRELEGPRAPAVLLMFAAYLDGKPGEAEAATAAHEPWVAWLTDEELAVVATYIEAAQRRMAAGEPNHSDLHSARNSDRPVIDVPAEDVLVVE